MVTDGTSAVMEPLWRRGVPGLGSEALSGSATCALPPRHEAVRSARDFTRRTLQRWQIARDADEVALVVSELVTNALRHGLNIPPEGPPPQTRAPAWKPPGEGPHGQPVRLQLMRWSARLVCAVRDPSEAAPRKAEPAPDRSAATGTAGPVTGLYAGIAGLASLGVPPALGRPEAPGSTEPPPLPETPEAAETAEATEPPKASEAPEDFPEFAAESGRGLYLVDSFSDCWGWHRLTGTRPGKVVWAMFRFTPRR